MIDLVKGIGMSLGDEAGPNHRDAEFYGGLAHNPNI